MSKIQATEQATLTASPERVFAALMDVPTYPKWFPGALTFELQKHVADGPGTRFRMSQAPVSWQVDVREVVANQAIRMRYHDGPWDGTASWEIAPAADGGTVLTYTVDLKLQGMMMLMLSKMVDTQKFHSEQMQKVFVALEDWLTKTQN